MPPRAPLRLLLALFFWRRLDLEGGAALVRGLVAAAPEDVELDLLLPDRIAGLARPEASVRSYLGRSRPLTLVRYFARLRRAAREVDGLVLLENNPAFHLLFSPLLPRLSRAIVFLVSPCLEDPPAGRDRRSLAHRLTKSSRVARWAGRLFGFPAAAYVVSTGTQRDQLLRLGFPAEKVAVASYGADFRAAPAAAAGESRAGERPLVVGYLGHFSPVKGVPDLVRAVHALLAEGRSVELRIAWSGKGDATEVERLLAATPVAGAVRLEGRVDVPRFLAGLDLLVLPMRNESFPHPPLVLVEALAAGTPVVASDAGGLPDLLAAGPFGATFPRRDPAALADLLRRLAADRAPLAEWRRNVALRAHRAFDNRALWRALLAPLAAAAGAAAAALEPLERAR